MGRNLRRSIYAILMLCVMLVTLLTSRTIAANQVTGRSELQTRLRQATQQIEARQYREAIQTLEQLKQQAKQQQDLITEAKAKGDLGVVYWHVGEYQKSIQLQKSAIKSFRQLNNLAATGQSLLNLGTVLAAIGDYEGAEQSYKDSFRIFHKQGNKATQAILLSNLGSINLYLDRNPAAIKYFNASYKIWQERNDRPAQAQVLVNIASAYHANRQLDQALKHYQAGLALIQDQPASRNLSTKALALTSLGLLYEDQNDLPKAIATHQESVTIAKQTNNPQLIALALNNQGHTLKLTKQYELAEKSSREAIQFLEVLRSNLEDTNKVSLFDTQTYSYNLLQQILVDSNQPEAALEATEQGRARAFAELIAQRQAAGAAAVQLPPITLDRIRQIAKQQNSTIVEYGIIPDDAFRFMGKQKAKEQDLLIWVIQPNGKITLRKVDLRSRWQAQGTLTQMVAAARCLSPKPLCPSLEALAKQRNTRSGVTSVKPTPTDTQPTAINPLDYPGLPELHEILIAPIADLLPKDPNDRVILVPQESLFLTPFAALVDRQGNYLIDQHTITVIPSIQILGLTQRTKSIAWNANNVLIAGNPNPMPSSLEPLPAAEVEANAIAKVFRTQALIGKKITKAALIARFAGARLIHLATHGLLEYGQTDNLAIPGALALADVNPNDENAAFLTAAEIAKLPNLQADLVVLSACDTGRGTITGDGVLGLARSWMAAGASNVMVSLWAVNDQSTSDLMTEFYQAMQTVPNQAVALRKAIQKAREKYPEPYDWSAFLLMGS
jgi:tetratricopeptide (TPR) repeat protein